MQPDQGGIIYELLALDPQNEGALEQLRRIRDKILNAGSELLSVSWVLKQILDQANIDVHTDEWKSVATLAAVAEQDEIANFNYLAEIIWPADIVAHLAYIPRVSKGVTSVQLVSKTVRRQIAKCAFHWRGTDGFEGEFLPRMWGLCLLRHQATLRGAQRVRYLHDHPRLSSSEWTILTAFASGAKKKATIYDIEIDCDNIKAQPEEIAKWTSPGAQHNLIQDRSVMEWKPDVWRNLMITVDALGFPIARSSADVQAEAASGASAITPHDLAQSCIPPVNIEPPLFVPPRAPAEILYDTRINIDMSEYASADGNAGDWSDLTSSVRSSGDATITASIQSHRPNRSTTPSTLISRSSRYSSPVSPIGYLEDHLYKPYLTQMAGVTKGTAGVGSNVPMAMIYTPIPIAGLRGSAHSPESADVWCWTVEQLRKSDGAVLRPIILCSDALAVAVEEVWGCIDNWLSDQDKTRLVVWVGGSMTTMSTCDVQQHVRTACPIMVPDLCAPAHLIPHSVSAWISRFDCLEDRFRQRGNRRGQLMRAYVEDARSRTSCMLGVAGAYAAEEWHALEGKWVQVVFGVVRVLIGRARVDGACGTADARKAVILKPGSHIYIPHETPHQLVAITTCLVATRLTWDETHIQFVEQSTHLMTRQASDGRFAHLLTPSRELTTPVVTEHWRPWELDP